MQNMARCAKKNQRELNTVGLKNPAVYKTLLQVQELVKATNENITTEKYKPTEDSRGRKAGHTRCTPCDER